MSQRSDWEEMASIDPLWAILSEPSKRGGKWELEEFFASGEKQIQELVASLPAEVPRRKALDFGCGVGRLTKALARHFDEVHGVDISEAMLAQARQLCPECVFHHNDAEELQILPTGAFDLVYSYIVLQHQRSDAALRSYIREFVRVLSPQGIAVFQVPARKPLWKRLEWRRRAYTVLHSLGMSAEALHKRKLSPITMRCLSPQEVAAEVAGAGGAVVKSESSEFDGFENVTYYVRRQPAKEKASS